uniref:Arrestin_N domain-containing protein n=1 Tax=Glossina austeni TaxID=7395 RepID=A0A1A9VGU8_GLOAU
MGEANTEWSDTRRVTNSEGGDFSGEEETITYKGHEEYFQIQYYLLGGENSAEIELPTGSHTYQFMCALPVSLPSSFEDQFGYVRYRIKTTLDRPSKFDQDMEMAFTFIAPVDLNLYPQKRAKESRTFTQELEIPTLPPRNLVNCIIIGLNYDLHMECYVSEPHPNLSGDIPLMLGASPLTSFPNPHTDFPTQVSTQASKIEDKVSKIENKANKIENIVKKANKIENKVSKIENKGSKRENKAIRKQNASLQTYKLKLRI